MVTLCDPWWPWQGLHKLTNLSKNCVIMEGVCACVWSEIGYFSIEHDRNVRFWRFFVTQLLLYIIATIKVIDARIQMTALNIHEVSSLSVLIGDRRYSSPPPPVDAITYISNPKCSGVKQDYTEQVISDSSSDKSTASVTRPNVSCTVSRCWRTYMKSVNV